MFEYEKLGFFYLGKMYDPDRRTVTEEPLLYDSKDLTTHAVCVGMTGSGKTGLCIGLLEEAALDRIPAIAIDPKGDITNLMLAFPELTAENFRPWVNLEEARKKGLTADEFARKQADLWRKGLAEWGQGPERIRALRDSAEFSIYTPGSTAGLPISLLENFAPPGAEVMDDAELFQEHVANTATGLLTLLGLEADPIQSREHILISNLLQHAWSEGRALDLPELIRQIQTPPLERIGILDLESFFPAKERFRLAMSLNNLLAAPGFTTYLQGEPLDIQNLLYTPSGKPRVSIISIAHLGENERMFIVTLLMNELLAWMRTKPGTSSLRAVVYMDEIYGYLPPVANPPSKKPMLTLLKQARAYGVGMVLATQNPVDLDYKGLSNTGTWFIGRLQTERDKDRVLDGLEGASAAAGGSFDRRTMDRLLAGLGKRVFLLNNVHEKAPVLFQTRWVMSYLRGPLTRTQIKELMQHAPLERRAAASVAAKPQRQPAGAERPLIPGEIPQFFAPPRAGLAGQKLRYEPYLLAAAGMMFSDARRGIHHAREMLLAAPFPEAGTFVDFEETEELTYALDQLDTEPLPDARFASPPASAFQPRNYKRWSRELESWLYQNRPLEIFANKKLKVFSAPGESESEFRIRLREAATEARDAKIEKLRRKYAPKLRTLENRRRRAEHRIQREAEQAREQKYQTLLSVGTTVLGALLGRKAISSRTLSRASTTARRAGRVLKESQDIRRAEEELRAVEAQLQELEERFQQEIETIRMEYDALSETYDTVQIRAKKRDIEIHQIGLVWIPS